MRLAARTALVSVLLGVGATIGYGAMVWSHAVAYTAKVVMIDNDAAFRPAGNPGIGQWGYGPQHLAVTQGDQIEFDNPATGKQPHTITSLTWSGSSPYTSLDVGTAFNSSPTRDHAIKPGSSWTLDTSTLQPGQYLYFCEIHPWMVGTFTVAPAS